MYTKLLAQRILEKGITRTEGREAIKTVQIIKR